MDELLTKRATSETFDGKTICVFGISRSRLWKYLMVVFMIKGDEDNLWVYHIDPKIYGHAEFEYNFQKFNKEQDIRSYDIKFRDWTTKDGERIPQNVSIYPTVDIARTIKVNERMLGGFSDWLDANEKDVYGMKIFPLIATYLKERKKGELKLD